MSSPEQAQIPTQQSPEISLPIPEGEAEASGTAGPAGTATWLSSPRLSANPLSPGRHTPFFKSWVM